MDLEYALITSSSLPDKVRESDYFQTLNKAQLLDLGEYSEDLVHDETDQKVLLLMVARGTQEQEEEDARRKEEAEAAKRATQAALSDAEAEKARLAEEAAREAQAQKEDVLKQKALRERSRSIINGLYNR